MISVIIATKDRRTHLLDCLSSLSENSVPDFEVIVADQKLPRTPLPKFIHNNLQRVTHVFVPQGGKSVALNHAIRKARGTIIAFTDDDCIVPKNWIQNIQTYFRLHPHVDGILGSAGPYRKRAHPGLYCPAVYMHPRPYILTKPPHKPSKIGFGNNNAVRLQALRQTDGFRTWLGHGYAPGPAEDADMVIQLLLSGQKLAYEPSVTVMHNRWVSAGEFRKQHLRYTFGEYACMGYYAASGKQFALSVLRRKYVTAFHAFTVACYNMISKGINRKTAGAVFWKAAEPWIGTAGILYGWYHAIHTAPRFPL